MKVARKTWSRFLPGHSYICVNWTITLTWLLIIATLPDKNNRDVYNALLDLINIKPNYILPFLTSSDVEIHTLKTLPMFYSGVQQVDIWLDENLNLLWWERYGIIIYNCCWHSVNHKTYYFTFLSQIQTYCVYRMSPSLAKHICIPLLKENKMFLRRLILESYTWL